MPIPHGGVLFAFFEGPDGEKLDLRDITPPEGWERTANGRGFVKPDAPSHILASDTREDHDVTGEIRRTTRRTR